MSQFPSYAKTVDSDGNTVALVQLRSESAAIILAPVAKTNGEGYEVNIKQVNNKDELEAAIGKNIYKIDPDHYNEVLVERWGFTGSDNFLGKHTTEQPIPVDLGDDQKQSEPASVLDAVKEAPPEITGVDPATEGSDTTVIHGGDSAAGSAEQDVVLEAASSGKSAEGQSAADVSANVGSDVSTGSTDDGDGSKDADRVAANSLGEVPEKLDAEKDQPDPAA